jgi:pimeloyl-ACP methyl ester carboxylesterase
MRRFLRFVALGIAGLVALAGVAFAVAAWVYRDIPVEVMERKYGHPASRYVEIDGVRMHYVDEGSGPPVLLLHAHYSSLRMWEPWARAMKSTHRVVRLDLPSHGLTRPDPSGDYSLARGVHLIERFVERLGLERFVIAGASLGGTHALHFTAKHPERIERLILANPGVLEGRDQRRRMDAPGAGLIFTLLEYVTPRSLAELILSSGFADRSKVPPALVDEWHEFWLMEDQREAEIARILQYRPGDVEAVVREVRVPVLLMWGEANPIAKFEQAAELRGMLVNAPSVQLVSYPGVGHMLTYEAPEQSARDALRYVSTPLSR